MENLDERIEMFLLENGEEGKLQYIMELIEQSRADAFMDGYKYAIRVLQDAIVNAEKAQ